MPPEREMPVANGPAEYITLIGLLSDTRVDCLPFISSSLYRFDVVSGLGQRTRLVTDWTWPFHGGVFVGWWVLCHSCVFNPLLVSARWPTFLSVCLAVGPSVCLSARPTARLSVLVYIYIQIFSQFNYYIPFCPKICLSQSLSDVAAILFCSFAQQD